MTFLPTVLSALLAQAPACPAASAHVTIQDYNGAVTFDLCIANMSYVSGVLNVVLFDNGDGIFHNGFEEPTGGTN